MSTKSRTEVGEEQTENLDEQNAFPKHDLTHPDETIYRARTHVGWEYSVQISPDIIDILEKAAALTDDQLYLEIAGDRVSIQCLDAAEVLFAQFTEEIDSNSGNKTLQTPIPGDKLEETIERLKNEKIDSTEDLILEVKTEQGGRTVDITIREPSTESEYHISDIDIQFYTGPAETPTLRTVSQDFNENVPKEKVNILLRTLTHFEDEISTIGVTLRATQDDFLELVIPAGDGDEQLCLNIELEDCRPDAGSLSTVEAMFSYDHLKLIPESLKYVDEEEVNIKLGNEEPMCISGDKFIYLLAPRICR